MSKSFTPKASCSYNASDSDPYMTDEDSDYEPPSVPHLNVNQSQHVSELLENNSSDSAHVTPKRTRKRRLNIKGHKKQIRKNARLQGLEYETAKGKKVMKKELKAYEHRCRYKCHEINEADRQMLFTRFYQLKNTTLEDSDDAKVVSSNILIPQKYIDSDIEEDLEDFSIPVKKVIVENIPDLRDTHNYINLVNVKSSEEIINKFDVLSDLQLHSEETNAVIEEEQEEEEEIQSGNAEETRASKEVANGLSEEELLELAFNSDSDKNFDAESENSYWWENICEPTCSGSEKNHDSSESDTEIFHNPKDEK
ncbi:unnamed protein product [Diabrotica balteata]|uniref:Uncharacterized protein n=1 Tax=Diabrotica balteata TaxID=107213 RepID=A0A9N9TBT0_DIABA|nr:unnamed protein product [Diabrotica balteata]